MVKDNFDSGLLKATKGEVREYCFKVWRAENRDYSKAARRIKKEDYCSATRVTLSRWADAYGWVERADNLDFKEQHAETTEQKVLNDLIALHEQINTHIQGSKIEQVDSKTLNSLVSVDRQIVDIIGRIRKNKLEALPDEEKASVQFNLVEVFK